MPFRFDRNKKWRENAFICPGNITAKILSHDFPSVQSFFVEIILNKMADKMFI